MKNEIIPSDATYKEVIIIGNGPSGISLSYILSGYLPYLISDSHPDEMLSMRLKPCLNKCLLELDLEELAAGLEGRSTNPVSLLLDSLLHPYADMGFELEPLVEFRKTGIEIEHLVLGKGPPGGSWHKIDPQVLTLSLGSWMSLPGLPFHSRNNGEKRAYACSVANYYLSYVKEMNLEKNFLNGVHVSKVTNLQTKKANCFVDTVDSVNSMEPFINTDSKDKRCIISSALNYILRNSTKSHRCCKRPREANNQDQGPERKISLVTERGLLSRKQSRTRSVSYCDPSCDSNSGKSFNLRNSCSLEQVPYSDKTGPQYNWLVEAYDEDSGIVSKFVCKHLVLANGANDSPNKLELSRQFADPEWMFYDLTSLEIKLDEYLQQDREIDPVLIIGGGLTAADAVIAVRARNIPVIHVFRNRLADWNKQLPENMYPEYHKVHQMMLDGGSTYPLYTAYPEHCLTNIDPVNRTVILTSRSGDEVKLAVSFTAVLIGSRPDLDFFPVKELGRKKDLPIDCKSNPININKVTYEVAGFDNLFAVGPLAGDNFVRFIPGGALAVAKVLYTKYGYL